MAKCLECIHWKPCFNGKEWDAAVSTPCEHFAADAAPVVHAKWAYNINDEPYCEACGEMADLDEYEFGVREKIRFAERPYCSHCGARMDGGSV